MRQIKKKRARLLACFASPRVSPLLFIIISPPGKEGPVWSRPLIVNTRDGHKICCNIGLVGWREGSPWQARPGRPCDSSLSPFAAQGVFFRSLWTDQIDASPLSSPPPLPLSSGALLSPRTSTHGLHGRIQLGQGRRNAGDGGVQAQAGGEGGARERAPGSSGRAGRALAAPAERERGGQGQAHGEGRGHPCLPLGYLCVPRMWRGSGVRPWVCVPCAAK